MGRSLGPLAATLTHLDTLDEVRSYVAGDPDGAGWHRLDEALADDALLDRWYRDLLEGEAEGCRDLAGACLASYLAGIVAETAVAALAIEGRVWPLAAGALAVHRRADGSFDGVAVRRRRLRVLPGDPIGDHPDAEVLDGHALRQVVADELTALATAIFAAVRRRAPYGLRGMWGNLVDGIATAALGPPGKARAAVEVQGAWAAATALIDELAARVPLLVVRPRLQHVDWAGGTASVVVKGTCCLQYKVWGGSRDPCGPSYCRACPFRAAASRRAKWLEWLEEQAAAGE